MREWIYHSLFFKALLAMKGRERARMLDLQCVILIFKHHAVINFLVISLCILVVFHNLFPNNPG
jgi:hypothetical protein